MNRKLTFLACLASALAFGVAASAEVVVEVSLGEEKDNLYSRVGVLAATGGTIDWGSKSKMGEKGTSPRVSVEGSLVVVVYVSKDKDLMYQVGSLDLVALASQ
jgi:hypothetical protein